MSTKPRAWETPLVELLEGVPFDARMIYELSPTECLSIPVGLLCSKAAAALRQPAVPEPQPEPVEKWCLVCDCAGHSTDECHSTHGLNTPRDREIARLSAKAQPQPEPVGYCPAYELERLASGHNAYIRPSKFGPGALDGDVPLYTHSTAERSLK